VEISEVEVSTWAGILTHDLLAGSPAHQS